MKHVNAWPFQGILTFIDTPSDSAPDGVQDHPHLIALRRDSAMVYANIDFARKSQFVKAVHTGEPIVLWDSAANQPAVNGVVVVEAWANFTDREYWRDGRRITQPAGWHCRVRVKNGEIKEILDEDVVLLAAKARLNAMLASVGR